MDVSISLTALDITLIERWHQTGLLKCTRVDTKINGLKNFSNISGVKNKLAQTNKQNRLKQSLLRHLLFILFSLIIYTTKKSQVLKPFIFVSTHVLALHTSEYQ